MQLGALIEAVRPRAVRGRADGEITAVTYRADAVVPGALHVCVPGHAADGHDFAGEAVSRGAAALVVERDLPIDVTADPGRVVAAGDGRRRRRVLRPPVRRARRRRHHRHERQDDDGVPAPRRTRGGRASDRAARHRRAARRRARGAGRPDDARERRPPGRAPADGRRRRRGLRDGGVVARPRAGPRGRYALRRRRVHQPHAGPPRLPSRHGALLPRQGAAVRDAPRQRSTSTTRTAGGWRARPGGRCSRTPAPNRTPTFARTRSRSARAG